METHTQNMIVVYVTDVEKAEIKLSAKKKGMSRYLLDLHLENKRNLTSRQSRVAGADENCEDCREEFGHLENCIGCPYIPPPA